MESEEKSKPCSKCHQTLTLDKYYKNKSCRYGVSSKCISCSKAYQNNYHNNNKDDNHRRNRIHYERHKEDISEKRKDYYVKHRDEIKHYRRKYMLNKLHNDQAYRILDNIRNRLRKARKGLDNSLRTKELIGCDVSYLLMWFVFQCVKDDIDIDRDDLVIEHISPCKLYEQQKLCFIWSNLRLCPHEENMIKGVKVDDELMQKYKIMSDEFSRIFTK